MIRLLQRLAPDHAALSWAAQRSLERAVAAVRKGRRESALAALDEAIEHDPDVPAARLIAAQVRAALGQHQRALDELDHAASIGAEAQVDELRYRLLARLGWNHEARDVIERRIAHARGREQLAWRSRAVQLFGMLGATEPALAHLEAVMRSAPSAALELNAAHLRAACGDHERACAHARHASRLEPTSAAVRAAAALILAEGGAFTEAVEQARRAEELSGAASAVALRARLHLWARDLDAADAHARRALDLDGSHAEALRIRGAVALLRGEVADARSALDAAARLDPEDAETVVWRAEAMLRQGRGAEAEQALTDVIARSDRYLFAARVLRLLTVSHRDPESLERCGRGELGELCAQVVPEAAAILRAGERGGVATVLERVLERLGGNRGEPATWLPHGATPRPLRTSSVAGVSARRALETLRVLSADEVLQRLDALVASHPDSASPVAHRGAANLWLARYDDARGDLERAIAFDPHGRWAYLGLAALELVAGRPDAALDATCLSVERARGVTSAVLAHRGEALRRAGRAREAIAELETARALDPRRPSVWMNLALAWQAVGRDELAADAYAHLVRRAGGLLSDAGLAVGIDDWKGAASDPAVRDRVLESALGLMRGNRSARCVTYIAPNGALRTVPLAGEVGGGERDDAALASAAAWLERRRGTGHTQATAKRSQHRDVELVALRAGLRTAMRVSVVHSQLEEVLARFEAAGVVAMVAPITGRYEGEDHALVFAALNERDARRAVEAEVADDERALGKLLGYPECCIEAFVRRPDSMWPYLGARAAWVPRPLPRLNTLLYGIGARFISFEPCRYDCAHAAEAADAIALALAEVDEMSVRWCDEQLARAVLVDDHGAHVLVELDSEGRTIVAAQAIPTVPGQPIGVRARTWAQVAPGAQVGPDGTVVAGAMEALVVDFACRARGA